MPDAFQYDVFLSHNHADKPQVRRLAERLKAAGVRVWLDEWVIQAGDIVALKMEEGLEQSRVLLLCVSPAALASGWVALERSTAVHRDPASAGRRFIPVLLGDCDLPDTLRRYKYVDFREESETAFAEVLTFCKPVQKTIVSTRGNKRPKIERRKKGSSEGDIELIATAKYELRVHDGQIDCLTFGPESEWIATCSTDGTIRLWCASKGELIARFSTNDEVRSIAVLPNSHKLVALHGIGRSIEVWDTKTWQRLSSFWAAGGDLLNVFETRDESLFLSVSKFGDIEWREIDSGEAVFETCTGCEMSSVALTSDRKYLVAGDSKGGVTYVDTETGECLKMKGGHAAEVASIAVTRDGEFAFTGSCDKTIRIWNLRTRKCIGVLEGHKGTVNAIAVSENNDILASSSSIEESVRLWDWKRGACLEVISTWGSGGVLCLEFGPGATTLATGSRWGFLCLYQLTRNEIAHVQEYPRRYVNAKVVLLGEGTVGKTSLAHRLIEDRYVVQDRTHGMNVWRLELPLPPDTTLEREALLWDLAGQEDYRLIHQLFLEQTALALLLINPQKDDPFLEVGEWLKALKTATHDPDANRDAARLLIFSQIDVGGMKLGNAKIDRFREQHGFGGWLPTSAKTGENCSDKKNMGKSSKLKQLIAGSIPWDKLPWTSTPRLLAELKNAVMAMRDESDIRLLRFSELAQRLEQALPGEKFVESDARTAVTLLANHGLARPLKFGDLVLLRPDLINGYAGSVIRAARAHTDEIGCVLEADIYRADFDFTGVERLNHRPDEELLLRALVQTFLDHSLCIAENTPHGRHLVFPSQYRREKDIPHEPYIFVSYTFSGEWQTVWTTLVVRLWYSQEFAHRELWRNAAEFESARKQTLGLKIVKTGDGAATISLYFDLKVPDELKVIFIEYVHRHLAKYACEVTRDRRYVCGGCGRPFKDLDLIRELLDDGEKTIVCQKCRTEVELIDFIEQRLKSDPVARKILAMDEAATRELDTQALEQILIGHMMAIAGEANQIFRPVTMFDHGIDGEVEFKDNDGKASGKRIYIQLKSGNSYLRTRKSDGSEVFDVTNDRHLEYWISQPVDVYLVIRQTDELSGQQVIRWMNVTRYLKARKDNKSRQIIFTGETLDMEAVWKIRDEFFPADELRK